MDTRKVFDSVSEELDETLIMQTATVKNQVINFILFTYSTIGLFAIGYHIYLFVHVAKLGWDFRLSIFVSIYIAIFAATLFHSWLSYTAKVCIVLAFFFSLGLYSLLVFRVFGGGKLWLILFCLYVVIFFDAKKGLASVFIVIGLITTSGVLVSLKIINYNPDMLIFITKSPSYWATSTLIIAMNLICLIYSQGKFHQLLNSSISSLVDKTKKLKEEALKRQETETALKESEVKYRVLFESAGDGIILMKDDVIVDCNQKTSDLLGRKREAILLKTPFDFSPEIQPDGLESKTKGKAILDSLTGGETQVFEWEFTGNNGQPVYVEPGLSSLEFHDERFNLAILRDITEKKLSDDILLQEKQFSETVINSLPGIFFMYDENHNLVRWNRNHEILTGYSTSELRKMKAIDWVDENEKDYVEHKFQEGFVEGVLRLEQNIKTSNGGQLPFYLSGRTIEINARTYLIGIGFDLTERKEAEKALAASEKRFRELVESIAVGICIIKDNGVVYMNPKQVMIFGKYPESFKVRDLPFHPDDTETIVKSYNDVVEGRKGTFENEVRLFQYRKKAGKISTRLVYCNGSRITYMDEVAVMMTMVDITKTRELEKLVQLREKMVSLGHVAAGIAHEIRNPLSGINILVDGIREDFENPENADNIKNDIAEINKASNKISAVIKRVLDFSKPGRPTLSPADINNSVLDAVELSKATLKKSGISVRDRLAVNLQEINVDSQAMEQVVLNLINNAAGAIKEINGEKIIEVTTWREEGETFISVNDSGKGISDELKEKIFDPFFTTRSDGSGIGLSLCQRIVTDHGGTIEVFDSELGGAEFIIKLPSPKR